jgi:hypothetical protein
MGIVAYYMDKEIIELYENLENMGFLLKMRAILLWE